MVGPTLGIYRFTRLFCQWYVFGLNWSVRASNAVILKKLEYPKQPCTLLHYHETKSKDFCHIIHFYNISPLKLVYIVYKTQSWVVIVVLAGFWCPWQLRWISNSLIHATWCLWWSYSSSNFPKLERSISITHLWKKNTSFFPLRFILSRFLYFGVSRTHIKEHQMFDLWSMGFHSVTSRFKDTNSMYDFWSVFSITYCDKEHTHTIFGSINGS